MRRKVLENKLVDPQGKAGRAKLVAFGMMKRDPIRGQSLGLRVFRREWRLEERSDPWSEFRVEGF
jgi:hypothetical protein